ncbi:hypothetical protein NPIL_338153 [Nephila pilipes]|uniref:Uncharacterized protein n=1 Tax=Nephila pilipes TaxID=299642 RepID=A0A8X6UAR9_NEPPI|nr:hypothetical protein NPIL_338153 [Nephila pilipes]
MSDKEPRRRKKRKDLQSQRKVHFSDDIHSDDQFFTSTKSEIKDSDQEVEEEVAVPSHQPSVFAKFVFVLLFSGLVVSMSFIFISLQGADRGEVDIFDDHHAEDIEILHDDHDELADHDDHDELADHDDHDELVDHDDHADHDEEESSKSLFQENIADYFPGISSILSFSDEQTNKPDVESIPESLEEPVIEQTPELPDTSSTPDYLSTIDQDSAEDNLDDTDQGVEDIISSDIYTETTQESTKSVSSTEKPEFPKSNEPVLEHQDLEQDSDDVFEELDFTTHSPEVESVSERYLTTEEILDSTFRSDERDESFDQVVTDAHDFVEATTESIEEEFSYYDKESITNEEDFKIRDQLDELENILQKDDNDDDNDNDDDDDDEYNFEEGTGDEFDFWQF